MPNHIPSWKDYIPFYAFFRPEPTHLEFVEWQLRAKARELKEHEFQAHRLRTELIALDSQADFLRGTPT